MKATKSKMSKQFTEHRERGLRCMADGGLVGNRMQRMEAMAGATAPVTLSANPGMASMTPQPVQPVAAPQPVQPMTPEEAEWQRIKAEKLAPKPTIMSKVKKTFGFADGGSVWSRPPTQFSYPKVEMASYLLDKIAPMPAPDLSGNVAPARRAHIPADLPVGQTGLRAVNGSIPLVDPNAMKIRKPVGNIGVRGADGGSREAIIKQQGLRGALRAAEVHEGPGKVKGPKGKDKVNARLTHGEYVVPEDTVEAVGKEALDDMVLATHEFDDPRAMARYIDGGEVYDSGETEYYVDGGSVRFGDQPLMRPVRSLPPAPFPAPPAPPPAGYEFGKRVGESVRNIGTKVGAARGLVGSAVAASPLAGFGDYKIDEPGVDSSAMGTLRAAGNQIMSGLRGTALPSDREATQATLRKGAVEAGLDSMSGLTKTFDAVTGLVGLNPDTSGDLARTVQSDLGGTVRTPVSSPAAVPDFRNVQSGSSTTAGRPAPQPTDWEGRGAPLQTRAGREAQLRAAYAPTQYGKSLAEEGDEHRARAFGPGGFMRNEGPFDFEAIGERKRGLRTARLQMELNQRERDSQRQYGAAAARDQVTMRGQDMTAKTAAEAAVRDQENKDRQYSLDERKYGTEQAKELQQRRETGAKATQERVASMIPPGPDGKPDTARAAKYMAGLNAMLSNKVAQTKAYLAKNPGDANARAWLAKAESESMGALGEDDIRKFVAGMEAKEIAEQEHSGWWNPIGGTAVQSDAPVTSMKRRPGLIFDDYVTDRGDVIPARSIDKRNGLRNTNQDILKGR